MNLIPFSQHFSILPTWFPTQASVVQWGGPKLYYPLDIEQMEVMLLEGLGHPPARLCWMALADGLIVGHAQLAFDWTNGNAVIGRVAIAPEQRGKGYAIPMLRLIMAEAFNHRVIQRLELNVFTFNQAAIHTYQRLGFIHEGTRRSATLVDNERWDVSTMSVLRNEYHPE
ncbi:MAG: GNAT family N-acetyltransferase [Anaerolineae bacterium]|nr:GNAT family N-acetyltransferase [Anaerolineae bacterium]